MYSTGSETSARDTLQQFEQVPRRSSAGTLPTRDAEIAARKVRIVALNSLKEYEPYRLNEFATAYYYPGVERDMIVMSHSGIENFPVAIHEYVHLVMQHAGVTAAVAGRGSGGVLFDPAPTGKQGNHRRYHSGPPR